MDGRRGELITSLLILALSWWLTLPEHQQRALLMRAAYTCQRGVQRLARRAAVNAMEDELCGDQAAAELGYEAAYRLMTGLYRRAERWYDRTGGTHA